MSDAVVRISPGQIRCIHALLGRAGATKEDVYAVYHVSSITQLSVTQAASLIDRLKQRLGQRLGRQGGRRAPDGPRLSSDATRAQRVAISSLMERLGWPAAMRASWLSRFGVDDLETGYFSRSRATDAINQLESAARRAAASFQEAPE